MKSLMKFYLTISQKRRRGTSGQGCFLSSLLCFRNEKGVAVVVALLVLLLLSVLAVTFTDTTVTEKAIVRSEAAYERAFYKAESGAMEGAQKLENASAANELLPNVGGAVSNAGLIVSVNADTTQGGTENNIAMVDVNNDSKFTAADLPTWNFSEINSNTYRRAILADNESVTGHEESLGLTGKSKVYDYIIFGYSDAERSGAMIKIRFRKIMSL